MVSSVQISLASFFFCSLRAALSDSDIFRAAKLLTDQHGDDAAIRAAQRAYALQDEGSVDGALEVCMTNQNGSILFEPAFTILPLCNRPYPRQIGAVNAPQAIVHKAFAGEF